MKLLTKKIFLWGISVLIVLLPSWADAYFEHTYWCVIDDKTIQVSLTTGDQLCFDYMAWLTKLLKQTNIDIQAATENTDNTTWYDHTYRLGILSDLTKKKDSLTTLQQQILFAMRDFEQELFVRVKWIVWYYLLPYAWSLEKKITQWKSLLTRIIIVWNIEQYLFVRNQLDQREREIIFLYRIQASSDFASLSPPLKRWIQLQETYN